SHGFRKLRWLLSGTLYRAYEDVHRHRTTWRGFLLQHTTTALRRGREVTRYKLGVTEFDVFDISTNVRWNKVQGARSPYDGDDAYWTLRNAVLSGQVAERLYRRQQGQCCFCGERMRWNEPLHRHHVDGNRSNNRPTNLQLV